VGEHVDPLGAEFDGVGNWGVVDDAAVDQPPLGHLDRRKDSRNRRGRRDGVHRGSVRKQQREPAHDFERPRSLLASSVVCRLYEPCDGGNEIL
jgi:hypothetical protein